MSNIIRITVIESVDWIRKLIHDDPNGHYISFSLNTRYSQKRLIKKWERYCSKGCFVYLIPSYSRDGRLHYHGLCRFPRSDYSWVPFTINESGQTKVIHVPDPLHKMLKNSKTKNLASTFGDLHLMNDGQRVTFLTHESEAAEAVLSYWQKTTDGELRDVTRGIFFPHANRQKIHVRKGRTAKWQTLVRRSRPQRQAPANPQAPSITRDFVREQVATFLANGGVIKKLAPVEVQRRERLVGVSRRSQRVNRLGMRGVRETPTAQRGQRHWTL